MMPHNLNYQHLFYFWMVAREGRMAAAARLLRLSSATLSVQIRQLEAQYGQQLFDRRGRTLELSAIGRVVYRYAESIFSIGRELEDYLLGRPIGGPLRLEVGVAQVLPKLVTWRLLEPVRTLEQPCHLVCREAAPEQLVAELVLHQVDVILSDAPLSGGSSARLFNHRLGDTPVSFMATRKLARKLKTGFPHSLDGAPMLLPTPDTAMRRAIDTWLGRHRIQPRIVAEFHDSALIKVAGAHGDGVFPVPELVVEEAAQHYGAQSIGQADGVREVYFAVSAERKIAHPAVEVITSAAREMLAMQA
jgi:LysR family transcriptional activator of nhaA